MKTFWYAASHALIIIAAYSSPWWLDWRPILIGTVAYYLQLTIFGWCVLSLGQFQGERKTFHEWYLAKLGLRPDPRKLRLVLNYLIPPLLVLLALIWQVALSKVVPVRL